MAQPSPSPTPASAPLGVVTLTLGALVVFVNLSTPLLTAAGIALIVAGPLFVLRPPDRRRLVTALLGAAALAQAADLAAAFWGDLAATEALLDGTSLTSAPLSPIDHVRTIARWTLFLLGALTLLLALAQRKKGPEFPPSPRS